LATNQEIKDFYGGLDEVPEVTLTAHRVAAEARVADDEVSATHARYDLLVMLAAGMMMESAGVFNSRTEEERVADVMEKFATTGSDGKPLASLEDVYQQFLLNVVGMTSNFDGTQL
jgi:NAD(P)H-nitrite reductase large subunit